MDCQVKDSEVTGVCEHGMSINNLDKKYYEQPIGALAQHPPNLVHKGGTTKLPPFVNNRHFSKNMGYPVNFEDHGHAKPYYNRAREALYARYSANDWRYAAKANCYLSTTERNNAGATRANAQWCIDQTDARTKQRQQQVTDKLSERIEDISYWEKELQTEIKCMDAETSNLRIQYNAIEKLLTESVKPFEIAQECLRHRENRRGIELTKDNVEKALNKEVLLIKQSREKMKAFIDKITGQLKLNTAALQSLETDNQNKAHAHGVDNNLRKLTNSSTGIGYHPGIEYFDNTITVPSSWARYTQTNIKRSQKERDISEKLRCEIDAAVRQCLTTMWNQFNNVNNALTARIRETTDAKNKMVSQLNRTMDEMAITEKNIASIRQAICDKEAPMKVAQTRLEERSRRIEVELCHDTVMKALVKEIDEIRESVRILRSRLKPLDLTLARLIKTMNCLKHDIAVKDHTIDIDNRICLGMRKIFPMQSASCLLNEMPVT